MEEKRPTCSECLYYESANGKCRVATPTQAGEDPVVHCDRVVCHAFAPFEVFCENRQAIREQIDAPRPAGGMVAIPQMGVIPMPGKR